MMRVGLYRPVHVKTLRSQKLRMLLTHRSKVPRRSFSMAMAFDCSSLSSLRSVLLICAFSSACMCRVSTQTIGNSASARALNSHCDSGPASNPIRLKQ